MNISLKDQTILVTGASRGIGAAIALALADAGASVAIHFNQQVEQAEELLQKLGPQCQMFQANLEKPEEVQALFESVRESMGKLTGLVNNAGVAISCAMEGSDEDWLTGWQKMMDVNTRALGLLCKKAIQQMTKGTGGRIVNISSRAAFRGDTADYMGYAASKGAVVALTRSIARAYGKQNICAFNIAPGFVRTDMAQDFMDQYGEDFALNDIALNQLTQPKDIAPMVVLLLSGLSDHATGATIDMNAGSYVH